MLLNRSAPYPTGLKPGDFVQPANCFSDIFFEVSHCFGPDQMGSGYWQISYITYDKYGSKPRITWVNSATAIRRVIPAEMAVPVMLRNRLRFKASFGQYDPFEGFAPVGTPLRKREAA